MKVKLKEVMEKGEGDHKGKEGMKFSVCVCVETGRRVA